METRNKIRKAYIFNLVTVGLVLFAVLWMFSGFRIGHAAAVLSQKRWGMFRFYTVDSNILLGAVALVAAVGERQVLKGKQASLQPWYYILKLIGVVGVTLTMLVTVCFLAPSFENGWVNCFNNENLLLHLFIPLLSIFTFVRFECTTCIKWRHTITGIVSMPIYAAYYVVNCVTHAVGDHVPREYDWYGFFMQGVRSLIVLAPVIILVTYGISLFLWWLNRYGARKNKQ